MVDYGFIGGIMVIYIPQGVLAFTRDEVKIGLKRGKKFKRRTEIEKRLAVQVRDNGLHEALQEVTHANGNDIVCERETEHQA